MDDNAREHYIMMETVQNIITLKLMVEKLKFRYIICCFITSMLYNYNQIYNSDIVLYVSNY